MPFAFLRISPGQRWRLILLSLGIGWSGCDLSGPPPATKASPAPSPIRNELPPVEASEERISITPSATPSPAAVMPEADEPPADPSALARKYHASTEAQERGEIVGELWEIDTVAAIETIRQLYLLEREVEVKVDMIAGLSDSKKPETRQSRFGLIAVASAPGQPKEVREIAMQMLVDFEDPRAVSLLHQYQSDTDADVRESAREALAARKEAEEP